jgi:replication factor C large subunit
MLWVEKYRPKKFAEIKGQNLAVEKLKRFVKEFGKEKKAIILHGPPGTGKTTLAHTMAKEINSEIFELNASDLRNKNKLQEILKPAIEQQSLVKENKIILVDEVDGISAVDRGGLIELLSLIDLTSHPVIITANDIWDRKLNTLRKKSELVQLKEIDYNTIKDIMFYILRNENLFVNNDLVTNIAIKAKGDLRAAINDLQTVSRIKEPLLTLDERNKEIDIFNALRLIFKGKPTNEILGIFDSVNMSIDEIILWVEENIPLEYNGEELVRAYELLSKVDVFKGRIYKQQYWRFLVYENIFLSYGISSSKQDIKTGFTSYKKPTRILKIWLNNQRTAKKKSIAKKYSQYVHVGEKRAMREFPIIKQIIKSNPVIQKELRLNEEEIEYLMR